MKIQTVGVVGAGVMGRGVAQALAQTGHQVILVDLSDAILANAKTEIKANIRVYNLFAKEKLALGANEILSNITFSTDYGRLAEADFVVENATEKWEIKQPIYQQLDAICAKAVILAVNTSAIPITRIAGLTKRPTQVLGMHFMNPVPLKPMVEVIRAYHTSAETLAQANELLRQMGKEGIVVNDSSGFVTNRVMMLTVNEAIFLLQEQVAQAADIDRLFEQCFGHKMGPLATADLIGLDTVLLSIEVLYENFKESKYRPCPLLQKMVDAGLYGRKSGQGFFSYTK
ncbi:MAG: 3-hydroxyacyl-CoA dehydrogenase NAD-binding domain-containing protein [Chloroflexi bacterium]|nr:3-hydroxyacyl-CoA dehydrogenase NAD-binding domain-containing protein [Chloroflexota bacterium]